MVYRRNLDPNSRAQLELSTLNTYGDEMVIGSDDPNSHIR